MEDGGSISIAGTGKIISTGEANGQVRETYGTSSPVNERGQSKTAPASRLKRMKRDLGYVRRGKSVKRRPEYVNHIRGVRTQSSVTCLMDQDAGRDFVERKRCRQPESG